MEKKMNKNSPVLIGCCSCKGGAGRSTAAANIAVALMMKGKKVLLLDMDFGAPGLHEILRSCGLDVYAENDNIEEKLLYMGLQHLFSEFQEAQGFEFASARWFLENKVYSLREMVANSATGKLKTKIMESNGELIYLPASPKAPILHWLKESEQGKKMFIQRLQRLIPILLQRLKTDMNFTYIILDSPSGNNERSRPIHDVSDIILIFYRKSIQHSIGAAMMAQDFERRKLLSPKWSDKKIVCIPSCVEEMTHLGLDVRIQVQINTVLREKIEAAFQELPSETRGDDLGLVIRDHPSMHYLERVVMNEEGFPLIEDYNKIADHILFLQEDNGMGDCQ
jgi:MinD-like ATPase involved in chromosome partitioning or flagellar assembly